MKYLVLDTESGSRHSSSTLLTAYFMVMDEEFRVLGDLYLRIKPDNNEHYIVDAQGMGVNDIDIVKHDKIAIPYKQAKPLLYDFLKKHSMDGMLTPVGHAVKGDLNRVTSHLISVGSLDQFCSYHFIDTSVVLQFLRACGKMSMDCDGSVEALAKYFEINQYLGESTQYHDAKFDTQMTALIFQKMIELGKAH